MMVLSCDIGTSSLKLGVVDQGGTLRWFNRVPSSCSNAAAWLESFVRTVHTLPADLKHAVSAVAVSGHGPTLVPVDAAGRTTADILMWYAVDAPVSGTSRSESFFLTHLERFHREYPRRYDRTAAFLPGSDYLVFRLTGMTRAVIPHKGFQLYYWRREELSAAGLAEDKMPEFSLIGDAPGRLTGRMARRTGLIPGIPVFGCGVDYLMAMVGSGTVTPGLTCDRGGTTEAVNHCHGALLPAARSRRVHGFIPGTYTYSGFIKNAGRTYAWIKNRLLGKRIPFSRLDDLARRSPAGAAGVRFLPERFTDSAAEIGNISLSDCFRIPSDRITHSDLSRAFLEYVGISVRRVIRSLLQDGAEVASVRATGGLARSALLGQIKADSSGLPFQVPVVADAELLGNALVALRAAGETGSLEHAGGLLRIQAEYVPDPSTAGLYDDLCGEYASSSQA